MSTRPHPEAPTDERAEDGGTRRSSERLAWVLVFAVGLAGFLVGLWEFLVAPLDATPGFTADAAFFRAHLFFLLGFSFLGMSIAAVPFRRGERWSWYVLWSAPVVILGDAAMNYTAGGSIWPALLVLVALATLGLLLPYRVFFPRDAPGGA